MRAPHLVISALTLMFVVTMTAVAPPLPFRVVAHTGLRLTDIVWTGQQFLYVDNTSNRVAAAGPVGMPLTPFAVMPRQVEETRCAESPGAHGFVAGDLFCHSPDNKIYRLSANGKKMSVFAVLPNVSRSDGALAFDTTGHFDYDLIAATGRSGGLTPRGGSVFAITAAGRVRLIGRYSNPGGADEVAIAPTSFGSASGQALLTVDAGKTGSLVAMDAHGQARTLVTVPDGLNPIAIIMPSTAAPGGAAAAAGLYVTDTTSRDVYFVPASALALFVGDVVAGSELRGLFWAVRPQGGGFTATMLPTTLEGKAYNFEAALYIAE